MPRPLPVLTASGVRLSAPPAGAAPAPDPTPVARKPDWIRVQLRSSPAQGRIKSLLREHGLFTVCEEARCPNMHECWSGGTATFMILGDTCTRACRFCAVKTGATPPLDDEEPEKLADSVARLGLDYVVITSVDRDDLDDQGSGHFARCVAGLRRNDPDLLVEVLTPDFRGDRDCIERVVDAGPHVFAHNVETVERLQRAVRDKRCGYAQSIGVLETARAIAPAILTKTSIQLGHGESDDEVLQCLADLRAADVDIVTFGQYLRPTAWHLPVARWVTPEEFDAWGKTARELGFRAVASGPLVRSSYRAGELFVREILKSRAPTEPADARRPADRGMED